MSENREKKHKNRNCVFCKWLNNWEKFLKNEGYRLVADRREKGYFAVLSKEPKMAGHTLVISTEPYDDITGIELPVKKRYEIFAGVIEFSQKIKRNLNAKKVYITSMCDHYEPEEIKSPEKETTEHLHFHLLPRYEGAPKGERLFCLPGKKSGIDLEATPHLLELIKNRINK